MGAKKDTIYNSFKPIWIFCLMFGLPCYQINLKWRVCQNILKFYQKYLHGITVFALTFFLLYKTLTMVTRLGPTSVIQEVDVYFRCVANISSMTTSLVVSWRKQDKLIQAIKEMHEIERKLNKLSCILSYRLIKVFVTFELLIFISLWIMHFVSTLYQKYDDETYTDCILVWLFYFGPGKISHIHMIQFSTFILILKQQLSVLNTILKEMRNNDTKINDKKRLVALKQIKNLHSDITQTCTELNKIFSFPLLMKFLCEFIIIFTTIHYFIAGYTLKSDMGRKTIWKYYLSTLISHPPLYEILVVMIVCEVIYTEHSTTGKLLYLFRTSAYRKCSKIIVIYYLNNNMILIGH